MWLATKAGAGAEQQQQQQQQQRDSDDRFGKEDADEETRDAEGEEGAKAKADPELPPPPRDWGAIFSRLLVLMGVTAAVGVAGYSVLSGVRDSGTSRNNSNTNTEPHHQTKWRKAPT
jgi:hypothetical protein